MADLGEASKQTECTVSQWLCRTWNVGSWNPYGILYVSAVFHSQTTSLNLQPQSSRSSTHDHMNNTQIAKIKYEQVRMPDCQTDSTRRPREA